MDKEISFQRAALREKNRLVKFSIHFVKWLLIIGLSYIILYPIIQLLVPSLTYITEVDDPAIIWLPSHPTIKTFVVAWQLTSYLRTIGITFLYVLSIVLVQTFISSIVGFGFARFNFPGKKILTVVLLFTIAVPYFAIELSTRYHFTNFSLFGLVKLFNHGETLNLLGKPIVYILVNLTGVGLKGGLFIYIFMKFYSNIPEEIEESAIIDGASYFRVYWNIILPNAKPAIVTCLVLAFVWNYGDYQNSFLFNKDMQLIGNVLVRNVSGNQYIGTFTQRVYNIPGSSITQTMFGAVRNASILLFMLPLIIFYLIVQKQFVESFERSGVVG